MNEKLLKSLRQARSAIRVVWGKRSLGMLVVILAVLFMAASFLVNRGADFSDITSRRISFLLGRRMDKLESYMQDAMRQDHDSWMALEDLPSDMVVYRYLSDTLQSWSHQFSVDNDDISRRMVIPRFSNLRFNFVSPLSDVDGSIQYMNIGPKWYLVTCMEDGNCKVIGGLEIRNTEDTRSINGINPRLNLSDRFSLHPISYSGGAVISVKGYPLMKVIQESSRALQILPNATVIWITIILLICGSLLYLREKRSLLRMASTILVMSALMLAFFYIGYGMQASAELFSPMLYAGGPVLYSLGAVLIINLYITLVIICIYMTRGEIRRYFFERGGKFQNWLFIIASMAVTLGILAYIAMSFRSLILNSNITLELYNLTRLSRFTLYIYISYLALLSALSLLMQMARVPMHRVTGIKYNVFSKTGRGLFGLFCAAFLMLLTTFVGMRKERSMVEIWTNRLAMDRDLALEIQLRSIEGAIASDNALPVMIDAINDQKVVQNRITETYMGRISKEYNVSVYFYKDRDNDQGLMRFFNERVLNSVPISAGSRFLYNRDANGRSKYTGIFLYYTPEIGVSRIMICVEPKDDGNVRGYSILFDNSRPGVVNMPPQYSNAKYLSNRLTSFKGEYAYPTILTDELKAEVAENEYNCLTANGYLHFFTSISDTETIVISRQRTTFFQYMVAAFIMMLVSFFWISFMGLQRRRHPRTERNYYKSRVNAVLFLSMLMTLVAMSFILVVFSYRRNDASVMKLMTSKISTIQSLVETQTRNIGSYEAMASQEMGIVFDDISNYTRTDLTLYTPNGKVFLSTKPEIFERMVFGSRLDPEAYENIMYNNKRYFIAREKVFGWVFYTMYAPIFNDAGKTLAIVGAPYTDQGAAFKYDALFHSVFAVTVFFILLIITRIMTTAMVDKIFRPLVQMGSKMTLARTEGLEYIIYDKEDEISGLVKAYNLMVHDLSESTKQVAQVERERAWSEMARQVAHEIKNPLTPIKLQIQRLIRLKAKNDPSWEEKFDSISSVVLDSIDVLTDTANEFSTFAKLYTEEPVAINLDEMAKDQISIFDDKDNIAFQYFGLEGAMVMGPKPQLTRVFVNLLTNAVQAIENQQEEMRQDGGEPVKGIINLSLRNSTKDGYYDIVFEDNGPGIKDENRSRLFTPNFTTKSSGTGLGLSICKNILERCGGEISYSKSFTLQGACFTVRFPKKK